MEPNVRLFAVQGRQRSEGFYVASVPLDLDDNQVFAALAEVGIDGERILELDDWQSSSQIAVTFIPFPPPVYGLERLQPSPS